MIFSPNRNSQFSKSANNDADYKSTFGYRHPRTSKEDNKQGKAQRVGGLITATGGNAGLAHGLMTLGAKKKFGGGKAIAAGAATSFAGNLMYQHGDQKRVKAWQERTGKNPYPDSPSR